MLCASAGWDVLLHACCSSVPCNAAATAAVGAPQASCFLLHWPGTTGTLTPVAVEVMLAGPS